MSGDFIFLIAIKQLIPLALISILGKIYNHEWKSELFRNIPAVELFFWYLYFCVKICLGNAWIFKPCGYLAIFFAMIFDSVLLKMSVDQWELHLPFLMPEGREKQRWFIMMFCTQDFLWQILNYITGWLHFHLVRRS